MTAIPVVYVKRKCVKCFLVLPLESFSKSASHRMGRRYYCKSCQSQASKEYYQADGVKERLKPIRQAYAKTEKGKAVMRAGSRKYAGQRTREEEERRIQQKIPRISRRQRVFQKWNRSEKGKESKRLSGIKYRNSEHGKRQIMLRDGRRTGFLTLLFWGIVCEYAARYSKLGFDGQIDALEVSCNGKLQYCQQ